MAKIILEFDNEFLPALYEYFKNMDLPDDDGMTDVIVSQDAKATTRQMVKAQRILDDFESQLEKLSDKYKNTPKYKRHESKYNRGKLL